MKRALILAMVVVGIIGGVAYFAFNGGQDKTTTNYRPIILSKLGALECYTYNETVVGSLNGSFISSNIEGGYFNGTYFFHGVRSDGLEWWTVITGNKMVQRILINGIEKRIAVNISDNYKAMMLTYDPVKFALRAVGVGMKLEESGKRGTYRYTLQLGDGGAILSGNVTVELNDELFPEKITMMGTIFTGSERSSREIKAKISPTCSVPDWAAQLKGEG